MLNPSGTVTYTPTTGYVGADSFTYTVSDGLLTSNAATVSLGVGNLPPVAVDDGSSGSPACTVNEDGVLIVSAANRITANDSDPNGDAVTATLVTDATHGHVVLSADGSFTYTPNANSNGPDHFTYQDVDIFGAVSNVATVYIGVTAVNDVPSFTKGADQTVLEDSGAQSVAGWATAISRGPSDESSQTVNFIVSNDNNALVRDAAGRGGERDPDLHAGRQRERLGDGDRADSRQRRHRQRRRRHRARAQTFTITVTAVNDAPIFVKGANQSAAKNSGAQTVAGWATGMSVGPANEAARR